MFLHYPQGNERTGDIRSSWVDVTTAAGPILLRLGRATKMAEFWSYFRDFVGAQKIEDLSESNNFFAEVFQIQSRFVLAKKHFGVRSTLSIDHYFMEVCLFEKRTILQIDILQTIGPSNFLLVKILFFKSLNVQ